MRKNIFYIVPIVGVLFLGGGCSVSPVRIQSMPPTKSTPIIPIEARNVPLPDVNKK